MAKNIIMQVLTSVGYEPMYPFNPALVLNAKVETTSTATQYNLTITGVSTPLTNAIGNQLGLISFIPNVNNGQNSKISINGDTAKPILDAAGIAITNNTLTKDHIVYVRLYNGNFYLIIDKAQVGLNNVDNTSDLDKPISRATQTALNNKLNIPQQIPRNTNLNSYNSLESCGFYYCVSAKDAQTIANIPVAQSSCLMVEKQGNGIKQTFTAFSQTGIRTWVRFLDGVGNWYQWYQQAFVLSGTAIPTNDQGENGNIYIKYE